jgi:hypothetical protein
MGKTQNLCRYSLFLHKLHPIGLLRQWRTRSTHKQREGNMNTIAINNELAGEIVTITYTEVEVLGFIDKAKEVDDLHKSYDNLLKEIRSIKNEVRDFFSEGEWSDGETTCNKGDVNAMLDRIGCNKLTTKYRGTFMVNGSFEIEVEDEDEIESIITDNLNIDCYDADIEVDSIEVHDIEEN